MNVDAAIIAANRPQPIVIVWSFRSIPIPPFLGEIADSRVRQCRVQGQGPDRLSREYRGMLRRKHEGTVSDAGVVQRVLRMLSCVGADPEGSASGCGVRFRRSAARSAFRCSPASFARFMDDLRNAALNSSCDIERSPSASVCASFLAMMSCATYTHSVASRANFTFHGHTSWEKCRYTHFEIPLSTGRRTLATART